MSLVLNGTTGVTSLPSINSGQIGGRRNVVCNPNFAVNQRHGTAANTTINTYAMDRWRSYGGPGDFSWYTKSDAGEGDGFYSRFQRTASTSQVNVMGMTQGLESVDSKHLAGKEVTLSFRAKAGANWSPTSGNIGFAAVGGEGTDQSPVGMTTAANFIGITAALTTSWVTYSGTGTIPADKTQISFQISWTPVGTAGAADYVDIRNVQLELGGTATTFEQKTYGEELALCQRYCFVMAPSTNASVAPAFARSTTVAFGIAELPVTMRTTPTLAFSANNDFQVQFLAATANSTAMAASPELHKNMIAFTATVGSGLTAGQGMYIRDLNGGATITASAEL